MSKNKKDKNNFGDTNFKFFTYVGLQVMATLSPILSLYNSGINLKKIFLFATLDPKKAPVSDPSIPRTGASYEGALRIKKYLADNKIDIEVEIVQIENDSSCIDVFIDNFNQNYEEGYKTIFGSEGGQNAYLVPAFYKLRDKFDYFSIASGVKNKLVDAKSFSIENLKDPIQVSAEDILKLQNVNYSLDSNSTNEDGSITYYNVTECLEKQKVTFPKFCLKNVNIGEVHYDLVWPSKSNRLKMLCSAIKKVPSLKEYFSDKKRVNGIHNQYIRHLIASKDKAKTNGLSDKFLYVITNLSNDEDRISKEGDATKIAPIYIKSLDFTAAGDIKNIAKSNLQNDAKISAYISKAVKEEIFDKKENLKKEISSEELELAEKYSKPVDVKADSLVFVYSPGNPASAIRLLNTYKKTNTVICCTSNAVSEVETFISTKNNPENFQIVVCNIEGTNLDKCFNSFESPETIAFNATPGTKSQGVFLSEVAQKNGCQLWINQVDLSKKNKPTMMVRLDSQEEPLVLKAADFVEILESAQGKEFVLSADKSSSYNQERVFFSEFLKFLAESDFQLSKFALSNQKEHKDHVQHDIKKNKSVIVYKTDNYLFKGIAKPCKYEDRFGKVSQSFFPEWTILNKNNNKQYYYQVKKGGEWLEVLVAQAVEDACNLLNEDGASHSRVRRARFANAKKDQPFLADYDVLGQLDGNNFIISCKSWSQKSTKQEYVSPKAAAKEVADIAKGFGKYTSSLLCHLECKSSYDLDGVEVFGQKELSNPQLLIDALKRANEKLHKFDKKNVR